MMPYQTATKDMKLSVRGYQTSKTPSPNLARENFIRLKKMLGLNVDGSKKYVSLYVTAVCMYEVNRNVFVWMRRNRF